MATAADYAQWIVANKDKKGSPDFDKVVQAYEIAKQSEPSDIPQAPKPKDTGIGETLAGVGEAALSVGTGMTGGAAGMIGGGLKGLAQQILSGQYGTPQSVQEIQKSAVEGGRALTYQPRTQTGQDITQAIGGIAEALPPVMPVIGPVGAVAQSAKASMPFAMATGQRVVAPALQAVQSVTDKARQLSTPTPSPQPFGRGSIGAAELPQAIVRQATAESLPVPLIGESGLTSGQSTRNFGQLQFEKETSKLADVGAPLRERVGNQSAVLSRNFEVLIDRIDPAAVDIREIGKGVDQALKNKMGVANRKISQAYKLADESGEMMQPVDMVALAPKLAELDRFSGVASNMPSIQKEAVRLGAVIPNSDGSLNPGNITLADSELLRQFVNQATDWADKRQAMVAKQVNASIDMATDGAGGELYKKARKLKRDYVKEFENVGITNKLTSTKRGTDERAVAYEDVFKKIILDSPVEEMNKIRATLLKAGNNGKQSWKDLKAQGIEHIKSKSYSQSQKDERGQPLLSPSALTKTVSALDADGKLDALYGKKQAQILRDIAELSQVIYTAPPGAINTSNTASAITNAIDTMATFGTTGIPVPAMKVLKEAAKYVKDRKLKARINESLNFKAN
jgi:hypothetical protein